MTEEHPVVVRCALQTFSDHKVICPGDWTVKKLKEYIRDFSDNKPDPLRQRLIYGGKCLEDGSNLSSVLRPLSDEQDNHVIHLVYTPTVQQMKEQRHADEKKNEIRHRNVAPISPPSPPTNTSPGLPNISPINQFASVPNIQGFMNNPMGSPPSAASMNDPQQFMLAQQQMYNTYMANYMNYMQQMYGAMYSPMASPMASTAPVTFSTSPIIPPNINQVVQPNERNNNNAANNNNNQPMVMNAQGGLVDADVDVGGGGDWLDWFYGCSRAGILAIILYFYSSFERFVFVALAVFVMYAIHNGWFGLRGRRLRNNPPNVNQGNAAPAPTPHPPHEPVNTVPEGGEGVAPPGEPLPPSAWHVFWSTCYTFVTAFFTSLIPERPPPVNIN